MARVIDHVLALLPFEPPYMQAAGMTCDFVGHPAAAEPQATPAEVAALRAETGIGDRRLLAILPGSRGGEVRRMAPVFADVLARLRATRPDLAAIVPAAGPVAELVRAALPPDSAGQPVILDPRGLPAEVAAARKRAAFAAADAALATSGTVSLELAAQGTPMVIAYDASPISVAIARRLIRIDTATLVNLVTDTRTVPEFIFEHCRPERIAPAVAVLLDDPDAGAPQRAAAAEAMRLLGRGGEPPGLRAARSVLAHLAPDPRLAPPT
jgi:lipid-A-disaccharide synthase